MVVLALLACAKTDALPVPAEPVGVRVVEAPGRPDENGRACTWEEESLWYGPNRLVGTDPPEGESCGGIGDHWQTLDIVGSNGPFLSVERAWGVCCPDRSDRELLTWDVVNGRPISILEYDEKWGEKRLAWARKAVERGHYPGLADPNEVDPARFFIRGSHVVFVVYNGLGHRVEIPVD